MPMEPEEEVVASGGGRSSTKSRKSKTSKSTKGWFTFGRKGKTVGQSSSSITDNTIPVNLTTPTQDIFSPLTPPPTLEDLGISFSLDSTVPATSSTTDTTTNTTTTVGSTATGGPTNSTVESSVGRDALIAVVDASEPHLSQNNVSGSGTSQRGNQTVQRSSGGVVTDLDQAAAAAVIQQRRISHTRRISSQQHHEGDTDDETNEVSSGGRVSTASEGGMSETSAEQTVAKEQEEREEEEKEIDEQKLSDGLKSLPALKFITRPDLYTFLNSAGVSFDTLNVFICNI